MYSNKQNVNILTSLMVQYGVKHAVVCPGSRNSPIVHNLNECKHIQCYPITDERSAGFYALGIAQQVEEPVAICVTSGSALLNVAPAVAEAYYQHIPLLVISADRPAAWIDQLDGQTIQQPGALQNFVRKTVSLPEPKNDEERWYCNRLVCEALMELRHHGSGPVHINVPISEPLYEYTVEELPAERAIKLYESYFDDYSTQLLVQGFVVAKRPMIIIGQGAELPPMQDIEALKSFSVVLYESLTMGSCPQFDLLLDRIGDNEPYQPDLVIFVGNSIVSKRLKQFIRNNTQAYVYAIDPEGKVHDTFQHLAAVIEGSPKRMLQLLVGKLMETAKNKDYKMTDFHTDAYYMLWQDALKETFAHSLNYEPAYSEMAVVKYFEEQLEDMDYDFKVQYANSSVVRLANIYAGHKVYCNRGVNGIEGCISTAAGMSAATDDIVYCVTGDLAFFYDQNALWNKNLKGNLRIILINNSEGAIFEKFEGLNKSEAKEMVTGKHDTHAQGICTQNDCGYMKATNMEEMQLGMVQLLTMHSARPVVLEVFTDAEKDNREFKKYTE